MDSRRVVVTGIGSVSPLGGNTPELWQNILSYRTGIRQDLKLHQPPMRFSTSLCADIQNFDEKKLPRKQRRSMSRISLLAVEAAMQALEDSGLNEGDWQSEDMGVSFGSTMGGVNEITNYMKLSVDRDSYVDGIMTSTFPKIMSHTAAANLSIFFQIPGRVIASCTACAAASQSIGFAYEAIKSGQMKRMLAGGAEELSPAIIAVFDVLNSTARRFQDTPSKACRPFDADRDGIVVGEGAGCLVLEDYESAMERGAPIYAEIGGFSTNSDASHMTNPTATGLIAAIRRCLQSANCSADQVDYVNAHATGTPNGDLAEAVAVNEVFSGSMPISSMKSYFGHLMGACGAIESILCLKMMNENVIIGGKNIENVDEKCPPLDFVREHRESRPINTILKNSFAFGGINACLLFKRVT